MRTRTKCILAAAVAFALYACYRRWRMRRFERRRLDAATARCLRTDPSDTVFVAVVSRDDVHTVDTVVDAFSKAYCAARVSVGVVQASPTRAFDLRAAVLARAGQGLLENVRVAATPGAPGTHAGLAVALGTLFRGERYVLCCDSRADFAVAWDALLVRELAACDSPRPMITGCPPSFSVVARETLRVSERDVAAFDAAAHGNDDAPAGETFLAFRRWADDADRMPRFCGLPFATRPVRPCAAGFWSARFSFSASEAFSQVPFDPALRADVGGEDLAMSARLWTSGWDFFDAGVRALRVDYRSDVPDACASAVDDAEQVKRIEAVLQARTWATVAEPAPAHLRLGRARSLASYEDLCGVCFARRTNTRRAELGLPKGTDDAALRAKHGTLREAERRLLGA